MNRHVFVPLRGAALGLLAGGLAFVPIQIWKPSPLRDQLETLAAALTLGVTAGLVVSLLGGSGSA
jgi:hypothetical protein